MLRNYFIVAVRSLRRNREYSIINILGLSVTMAAALLLFTVIGFETSFNTFHEHFPDVYRVVMDYKYPDGDLYTPGVPAPAPEALRTDFSQLLKLGTVFSIPNVQVTVTDKANESRYKEDKGIVFAEPEVFDILDFHWLQGNPKSALSEPNSVALTRVIAEKYFGTWQAAVGKTILVGNQYNLKVNGIIDNMPANSDFPFSVVISFLTRKEGDTSWGNVTSRRQCYVLLAPQSDAGQIESLFPQFEKKHMGDIKGHFKLQPLSELHYSERYGNLNGRVVAKTTLYTLGIIGIFLLITAAINFVNLAIAQVMKKAKEVGVRKVLGSQRHQLIVQFFGDTAMVLTLAAGLALVLSEVSLPLLRPVFNLPANFTPLSFVQTTGFLVAFVVALTFMAGLYPAVVMAGFKPIEALKSRIQTQTLRGFSFRKGLVVVQFAVAQLLLIVTIVIVQQLQYLRTAPLGFNKDAVIFFSVPTDSMSRASYEALGNTLHQNPGIRSLSFSFTGPSWRSNRTANFRFDDALKDEPFEVNMKHADPDFFATYEMELLAGRIYQQTDTAREYLVNEAFLRKFGIKDPADVLGKNITIAGTSLPIVGVLRDFHNRSLHSVIEPLAFSSEKREYSMVNVKLAPGDIQATIAKIGDSFNAFFPKNMFEYQFLDETLAKSYQEESRLATLINALAAVAVFVSCLGLYGLVSFMAAQRTKEIGVRKVLGASVASILNLFGRELALLLVIAFGVAVPVAAYYMGQWLNSFAFHIPLTFGVYLLAGGITLAIAVCTVSYQSAKAALANPVDSLRAE